MAKPPAPGILEPMGSRPPSPDQPERCPVCDGSPRVLVAIRHPVMRRWTGELLASEHGCWAAIEPRSGELLADAIARTRPDVVVVDSVDFPACCRAALDALPRERVIVIGPEPDPAYRSRALTQGAGGWVCRDHVADELSAAMRAALGCRHDICPPSPPCAAFAGTSSRSEGMRP